MRNSILFMVALLTFATASCGKKQKAPELQNNVSVKTEKYIGVADWQGQFAICNNEGTKFLVMTNMEDAINEATAKTLCYAIFGSALYPIKYVSTQNIKDESSQQTSDNFNKLSGHIFEVVGKPVPAVEKGGPLRTASAYLVDKDFIKDNKVVPLVTDGGEISPAAQAQAEKKFGRKVVYATVLVDFGDENKNTEENTFSSVQFETKGKSALAVYMLSVKGKEPLYVDFPVTVNDENAVWRIDDGGHFDMDPEMVNSILTTPEGFVFIMNECGANGATNYFIHMKDGKLVQDEPKYYRCTAVE